MAYPNDELQDVQEVQRAKPPAGQRGPEAEAEPAAEGLTWPQRNLEGDSGAGLCDQYLLQRKDMS